MPKFEKGNQFGRGRPKGSKNKLSRDYLAALATDFKANGKDAIELLRDSDISTYNRILAGLIPKDIDLTAEIAGDKTRPIVVQFAKPDKDSNEDSE